MHATWIVAWTNKDRYHFLSQDGIDKLATCNIFAPMDSRDGVGDKATGTEIYPTRALQRHHHHLILVFLELILLKARIYTLTSLAEQWRYGGAITHTLGKNLAPPRIINLNNF